MAEPAGPGRPPAWAEAIAPPTLENYRSVLGVLSGAGIPFLVGGTHAFAHHTGIVRDTKDFDLFVHPRDVDGALEVLAAAGCRTEVPFPHWLAKAWAGADPIDLIFGSGNGVAGVDAGWFARAVPTEVFGIPVRLCPLEDMLWSKAFIMERERYDGADVVHLLHAGAATLDWAHLLRRFGPHWRVLLAHVVLFGFVYPAERTAVPSWVMRVLLRALHADLASVPPAERVCQGTLLSRAQYLVDVEARGYLDARLAPHGNLTEAEAALWTAAIEEERSRDERAS